MLTTHVLPRLLAHVLAMVSFCVNVIFFNTTRIDFTTIIVFIVPTDSLGHACAHCPKFLTAAKGRVVFIPYAADSSLKSTRDCWLTPLSKGNQNGY